MIVRGPEFWGLDVIVSMGIAYAIVLALALVVSAVRRTIRHTAAAWPDTNRARRNVSPGG